MKRRVPDRFKVSYSPHGVLFVIDHQSFALDMAIRKDRSAKDKRQMHKWFAEMLTIALRRLQNGGNPSKGNT